MAEAYDAVVVGGRVAGASTAMLLARAGARVAVLERAHRGSDTLSTHGLMRAGVLQLSRWGLLDDVVRAGTPAVRRTIFHYEGLRSVQVSIRPGAGVPALYAPRRHVVDTIILDAAGRAGVDVLHGTRVVGLVVRGGRVRGVRAVGSDGRPFETLGHVVVGADGVRSVVAATVGAPVVREGIHASSVLYRYYADLPVAGYEWFYGTGAAAGMIPTNDGLTCVFVATSPLRMRTMRSAGTEEAFGGLLDLAAPEQRWRVDRASAAGRMHGWSGMAGVVRKSFGPGWALVGDAGYFKDPITAHGMTDALRDAELLSAALLAGWSPGGDLTRRLAGYQARRDELSLRLLETTERIAAYDWSLTAIQRLNREVSSAMSDEVEMLEQLSTPWARRGLTAQDQPA